MAALNELVAVCKAYQGIVQKQLGFLIENDPEFTGGEEYGQHVNGNALPIIQQFLETAQRTLEPMDEELQECVDEVWYRVVER